MTTIIPPRNAGTTTVTARPTSPDAVPPIPNRADSAGRYQSVLLNTRTGKLSFHCADWRRPVTQASPQDERDAYYPGTLASWRGPHQWFTPVPERLRWVIDSGHKEIIPDRPYLTVKQGNEFADFLVPMAQQLVDRLFQVPGTTDLDWSAESATAVRDIARACGREILLPLGDYPDLVDFGDAVAAVPRLVTERPRWSEMDDGQLDRQCEGLTRHAVSDNWHRAELLAAFPGQPSTDGTWVYLELLGIRAWAYTWRAAKRQAGEVVADVR